MTLLELRAKKRQIQIKIRNLQLDLIDVEADINKHIIQWQNTAMPTSKLDHIKKIYTYVPRWTSLAKLVKFYNETYNTSFTTKEVRKLLPLIG